MLKKLGALLRPRRIDPVAFAADARAVQQQLRRIERHLQRKADVDTLMMVQELHTLLEQGMLLHGPVAGIDIAPFSGGTPKPE